MDIFGKEEIAKLQAEILAVKEENQTIKNECEGFRLMYEKFKERCTDLEDAFKTEHGIVVRQEVTKVIADFDKIEMIIIMAAVATLIYKGGAPAADLKLYIKLSDKIQSFVNDMDEPKEVSSG